MSGYTKTYIKYLFNFINVYWPHGDIIGINPLGNVPTSRWPAPSLDTHPHVSDWIRVERPPNFLAHQYVSKSAVANIGSVKKSARLYDVIACYYEYPKWYLAARGILVHTYVILLLYSKPTIAVCIIYNNIIIIHAVRQISRCPFKDISFFTHAAVF